LYKERFNHKKIVVIFLLGGKVLQDMIIFLKEIRMKLHIQRRHVHLGIMQQHRLIVLQVNTSVIGDGLINITGTITSSTSMTAPIFNGSATSAKTIGGAFDIPHFKDDKKRIRHVIAEGPEAGIYVRGTLKDSNKIELPEYWDGIVDPETITVTLTQIGYSQDLIVEGIEWGKIVKIKSGTGANIHCYYEIWAARYINPLDHEEKLHVVYEGDSPEDYPGNNEYYLIGGWDYDRRETKWRSPEDKMGSVNLDKDP
jgi:hypothetical protein